MKYVHKPIQVEAVVWNKNGDHPLDNTSIITEGRFRGESTEGQVVRYYRHPSNNGDVNCAACGKLFHEHGWLDNGGVGQRVCPGNWVIMTVSGTTSAVSAAAFAANYTELPPVVEVDENAEPTAEERAAFLAAVSDSTQDETMIKNAERWCAFRDRDSLLGTLQASDFNDVFGDDADALIDEAIEQNVESLAVAEVPPVLESDAHVDVLDDEEDNEEDIHP
jgi:hypothetical protein